MDKRTENNKLERNFSYVRKSALKRRKKHLLSIKRGKRRRNWQIGEKGIAEAKKKGRDK